MKFFVPLVEPKDQESTYQAIAKFNASNAPAKKTDRVCAITWTRFGTERHAARVGEPAEAEFGGEEVLAIIQTELSSFAICTATRGGAKGAPIHVNFADVNTIEKFTG